MLDYHQSSGVSSLSVKWFSCIYLWPMYQQKPGSKRKSCSIHWLPYCGQFNPIDTCQLDGLMLKESRLRIWRKSLHFRCHVYHASGLFNWNTSIILCSVAWACGILYHPCHVGLFNLFLKPFVLCLYPRYKSRFITIVIFCFVFLPKILQEL